jgi:thioesterase domain-containing protein
MPRPGAYWMCIHMDPRTVHQGLTITCHPNQPRTSASEIRQRYFEAMRDEAEADLQAAALERLIDYCDQVAPELHTAFIEHEAHLYAGLSPSTRKTSSAWSRGVPDRVTGKGESKRDG